MPACARRPAARRGIRCSQESGEGRIEAPAAAALRYLCRMARWEKNGSSVCSRYCADYGKFYRVVLALCTVGARGSGSHGRHDGGPAPPHVPECPRSRGMNALRPPPQLVACSWFCGFLKDAPYVLPETYGAACPPRAQCRGATKRPICASIMRCSDQRGLPARLAFFDTASQCDADATNFRGDRRMNS